MNRAQRRQVERGKAKTTQIGGDVAVGFLHPSDAISPAFARSLADLRELDSDGALDVEGNRVGGNRRLGYQLPIESGANIVTARNVMVREFLKTDAQWLWIVDSDMEFHAATLEMLLLSADATERPIVGGLCFAVLKRDVQPIVPTCYSINEQGDSIRWYSYPEDQLFQVDMTGAACLLVHRRVFETMRDATVGDNIPGVPAETLRFPPPWPWFAEQVTAREWGRTMSEDLTFCLRARTCGFPTFVDSRIKIGHQKPFVVDEAMYRMYAPKAEPPAPTYVVIPVKGKREFTNAIVNELERQGGFDHLFIYDNGAGTDDQVDLRDEDRLSVVPAAGLSIHEMWNLGIKEALNRSPRCNIAILNNDLELGPDFLQGLASGLRSHPSIACVGPNYDARPISEVVATVRGIAAGREDGTGGLPGFAFMVRGEIFAEGFPLFDEQYELWYGDNDFTMSLDRAGMTYGIARDATVVHIGGGSQTAGDGKGSRLTPEREQMVERDRARFEKKWAGQ